ncbi:MAG: DUF4345 domain-containing protein [Opitutaceae bacterium]
MKNPLTRILLLVSGGLLLAVGCATLLQPHAFFAANGIALGNDPSELSEVRAPGGLLIGCALAILLGAVRASSTQTALILATMVYGLFGGSRLISIALDGLPSNPLIWAMATELIIGAMCLLALSCFVRRQAISRQLDASSRSGTARTEIQAPVDLSERRNHGPV